MHCSVYNNVYNALCKQSKATRKTPNRRTPLVWQQNSINSCVALILIRQPHRNATGRAEFNRVAAAAAA